MRHAYDGGVDSELLESELRARMVYSARFRNKQRQVALNSDGISYFELHRQVLDYTLPFRKKNS